MRVLNLVSLVVVLATAACGPADSSEPLSGDAHARQPSVDVDGGALTPPTDAGVDEPVGPVDAGAPLPCGVSNCGTARVCNTALDVCETAISKSIHRIQVVSTSSSQPYVWKVDYSPNGKWIAVGSANMMSVWNVADGTSVTAASIAGLVPDLKFHPNNINIAMTNGLKVQFWDIEKKSSAGAVTAHSEYVATVALSPDGKKLVSTASKSSGYTPDPPTLKVWDIPSGGSNDYSVTVSNGQVVTLYSPDGSVIVNATDGDISVLDPRNGTQLKRWVVPGELFDVSHHPFKAEVAAAFADATIRLYDRGSGAELALFTKTNHGAAIGVAYSPDGKTLATTWADGALVLWNLETQKEVRTLHEHSTLANDVAFSPDGTSLTTVGLDGAAIIWGAAPAE